MWFGMTAYSIGASSNMPELTVSPATMKKATTFQATRGLTQSPQNEACQGKDDGGERKHQKWYATKSVSLTTNPTASPYSKVRQTLITTPSDSDFTLKRSRSRSWMLKERYEEGTLALEKTRPAAVTGSAITHRRLHHRTRVPVTQKEQRKQQHGHEGERRPADHRHTLNTQ